jgi:uncharacterized membrane protein YbhN (UPF0104 family)
MKYLRWILSGAVVALLAYSGWHVDWRAALAVIRRASFVGLALAIGVNGASLGFRGVRWWIFLRPCGARSLPLAIRGAIVGSGFNSFLIANAGDAARVLLVARAAGLSRGSTLATMALDRVFDPLCFVLLLFVATFAFPVLGHVAAMRVAAVIALGIAALLLAALLCAPKHDPAERPTGGWRGQVHAFRVVVECLSTLPRFTCALVCSVTVWSFQLAEYAIVARSLQIDLPFAGSVAAMLLINAGLVFRATPGGVGYFQFAYAAAVAHFGIPTQAAVAVALLIQVVEIVPVTVAALVLAPGMADRVTPHIAPQPQPCML